MMLSQKSLDKLQGVHPELVSVVKRTIQITVIDFGISQGVRTLDQQRELYAQGRTKPGKIVTWTMNSKHLLQPDGFGHAIDVVAYDKGHVSWDEKLYDQIANAMYKAAAELGVKIKWGGEWRSPDKPHFQLA